MACENCMKIAGKKPPVPEGRQGGSHLHTAQQNAVLSPGRQDCSSGMNLNILGTYQQKGRGGQPGQRLPKAEPIEPSVDRGAADSVLDTQGCVGRLREALPSMAPGLHPHSLFPHKTSAGKLNRSAGSLGRRLEDETAAPRGLGL